jgi:ABC-type glycerol-3-phosphate transport system permease component
MKLKRSKTGPARSTVGDTAVFLILIIVGLFMILPFVYAIVQSLKPTEEIFAYPPKFFVRNPTFDNYKILSQLVDSLWIPFGRYFINSSIVTLIGTGANLFLSSMAAFAFAKYNFPGNKWMFSLVVAALLFSGTVTALPQYIIMSGLGLINTLFAVIIPAAATPLGLFLMKNFMVQIPDTVIEAATIDGAGILKIYYKICMPLVKPAALTLIIFSFQGLWNSTGGSYIYEEAWKLLPTVLNDVASAGIARVGSASAASVLMMIPPCVLFIFTQSRIVETMAFSGIKG